MIRSRLRLTARSGLGLRGGFALGQEKFDIKELTSGITDLLGQVPSDVLGTYEARFQACVAQIEKGGVLDIWTGGSCLYKLFKELKALVKAQEEGGQVTTTTTVTVEPPPAGIPLGYVLGGVAVVGVLAYFAFRPR